LLQYGITVRGKYHTIATIEVPSYFTLERFGSLVATMPVAIDTTESEFVFRKALIPSFRVHIPDEPDEEEEDMFPTTREDSEKWKKVQDSEEYMELHSSLTFEECLPFADPDLWLHLHY
jgi:hypothetical protein